MAQAEGRSRRKTRVGEVVSNKMEKTAVVAVTRLVRHPLYGRFVKKTSRFKVHDESNECQIGDVVRIMETRPISKDKRWRLIEVMKRVAQ